MSDFYTQGRTIEHQTDHTFYEIEGSISSAEQSDTLATKGDDESASEKTNCPQELFTDYCTSPSLTRDDHQTDLPHPNRNFFVDVGMSTQRSIE